MLVCKSEREREKRDTSVSANAYNSFYVYIAYMYVVYII